MITDHMPVVKKKRKIDRFNGMPEEEVILKTLPDRLAPNLDILIVSNWQNRMQNTEIHLSKHAEIVSGCTYILYM